MAKRFYDFLCKNDHTTEAFVDTECRTVNCKVCSESAKRIISGAAINLEGWSGSFPGAANKFDSRHREKLKAEQKANS